MPNAVIRSFADQAKVPASKVEGYWEWAKEQADKRFRRRGPGYWAYVNALTQRRLGLREANCPIRLKDFLALEARLNNLYSTTEKEQCAEAN